MNPLIDKIYKSKLYIIRFYNKTKCGIDTTDAMLYLYIIQCTTQR